MGNETQVPDAGGNPARKITPPQNRDSITFLQFQSLLSAVNAYMAFIANNHMDDANMPQKGPRDGGVKAAAEGTFIGLCSRVDAMIADESRWTMDEQNNLEQSLLILYADQRSFIKHQREAVSIMKAPHTRFKPILIKLETGAWAAVYGDPSNEHTSIIGSGASPEDALANFDDVFSGKIYEQKTNEKLDGQGIIIPGGQSGQAAGAGTGKPPRKKRRVRAAKAAKTPKKDYDDDPGPRP